MEEYLFAIQQGIRYHGNTWTKESVEERFNRKDQLFLENNLLVSKFTQI